MAGAKTRTSLAKIICLRFFSPPVFFITRQEVAIPALRHQVRSHLLLSPSLSLSASPLNQHARLAVPSLLLEVFLYFGKLWDVVFWVLSFLIFIYKGVRLPYPDGAYELEFACLFMYLLVEPPRLFLGSKGNKTLAAGPLYASCLLGVFVLFLHVYYILGEAAATVLLTLSTRDEKIARKKKVRKNKASCPATQPARWT